MVMKKGTKALSNLTVHNVEGVDIWLGVFFGHSRRKVMSEELELLVFELGENEYVVDVSKVLEIISFDDVLKVPGFPSFMLGVIKGSDVVIPAIDLRIKFITPNPNPDQLVSVIILTTGVGLVVDRFSDLISASGPIGPPEVVGASGTYSVGERTLHLLNTDALVELKKQFLIEAGGISGLM